MWPQRGALARTKSAPASISRAAWLTPLASAGLLIHDGQVSATTTPRIFAAKGDIPLPVRPPGHTVDVSVHGPDGRVLDSYSLHSGSMSPGEQALGFPQGPLASHTENRVARVSGASSSPAVSGDPFAGLRPVSSGDYVVIQGTKPPCPSCQGALNRAQVETGATFVYVWNGGRSWWQAGRPLG